MWSGVLRPFAIVEDAGWDVVLLTDGEQAAAVDQVQWLAAGKLVAVGAVAGRGDHDSLGRALMLHRPPEVAYVGWLNGPGIELGLNDELAAGDGVRVIGDAVNAAVPWPGRAWCRSPSW
jgi:hypothetical protein